jgi:hypothetical protein
VNEILRPDLDDQRWPGPPDAQAGVEQGQKLSAPFRGKVEPVL